MQQNELDKLQSQLLQLSELLERLVFVNKELKMILKIKKED